MCSECMLKKLNDLLQHCNKNMLSFLSVDCNPSPHGESESDSTKNVYNLAENLFVDTCAFSIFLFVTCNMLLK